MESIAFSDGSVKEVEPVTTKAMNPSVAYTLNQILRGVPGGDGTASGAAIPAYTGYAGKTGSVDFDPAVNPPAPYGEGSSDIWYCSYTNGGYAISVWTGYDVPNESPPGAGLLQGAAADQPGPSEAVKRKPGGTGLGDAKRRGADLGKRAVRPLPGDRFKDLDETGISWADVSGYGTAEIDKAKPDNSVPEDWEEYEFSPWYDYYREHGTSVPDVIGPELYKDMKGEGWLMRRKLLLLCMAVITLVTIGFIALIADITWDQYQDTKEWEDTSLGEDLSQVPPVPGKELCTGGG